MNSNSFGKILIVDDNEINRYSTARILKSAGYDSVEADCGQEGLRIAAQNPELILLDVNLPDIDGFHVCKLLRSNPETSSIPIVHTSATFVSEDDRIQGLDVGADGYLTRPFEPRVLIATIRSCLRARKAETDREKYVRLVEQSRDLIAIYDTEGQPSYLNFAGMQIAGVDSIADATLSRLKLLISGGDLTWLATEFLPLVKREGHGECELRIRTPSGDGSIWLNCRLDIEKNASGNIVNYFAVCREVSEQKHLEDKLRTAIEHLSASNRKLNEFIATLAHELRNPMSPIRMGLELIRIAGDDVVEIHKARAMMERQALQMIRLIDDLLDLSRITQGKLTLRYTQVNLADVLEVAVDAVQPAAIEANHTLQLSLPTNPILLMGDPNRLAQVFGNLLNNAVKYTLPNGKITVSVEHNAHHAVVSIQDNGLGIPESMQQSIFEMFTQVERSIEHGYTGLGIGLTLVKQLVEMHRGIIEVHSEGTNCGSTFIVRLPYDSNAVNAGSKSVNLSKSVVRHRILIVDDNRDSAAILGLILKVKGNEVALAHDGEEAVAVAESFRPSVVLMDIGMPKKNGYDAAKDIRQAEWGKTMILVALTGWGQEEDKIRTRDAGFDFHLIKPAEPSAIQDILESIVN